MMLLPFNKHSLQEFIITLEVVPQQTVPSHLPFSDSPHGFSFHSGEERQDKGLLPFCLGLVKWMRPFFSYGEIITSREGMKAFIS